MERVSAHDVAREIRARISDIGAVKLQKLLYYCQGWHLALTGERLFSERIEAWTNGPVVADLWHVEDKGRPVPPRQDLAPSQLACVAYVTGKYRRYSARELIDMTHAEAPWRDAIEGSFSANPEITVDALAEFFGGRQDEGVLRSLTQFESTAEGRELRQRAMKLMGITAPALDPPDWLDSEMARLG